jgi:hypothetical protein
MKKILDGSRTGPTRNWIQENEKGRRGSRESGAKEQEHLIERGRRGSAR